MYYILVKRLLEKKPTVLQNHSDVVFLFNANGCQELKVSTLVNFDQNVHQDTWALVDINQRVGKPAEFIDSSPFFLVMVSSPKASLWYPVMRYRGPVAFWLMKPFSLAELIQASVFLASIRFLSLI